MKWQFRYPTLALVIAVLVQMQSFAQNAWRVDDSWPAKQKKGATATVLKPDNVHVFYYDVGSFKPKKVMGGAGAGGMGMGMGGGVPGMGGMDDGGMGEAGGMGGPGAGMGMEGPGGGMGMGGPGGGVGGYPGGGYGGDEGYGGYGYPGSGSSRSGRYIYIYALESKKQGTGESEITLLVDKMAMDEIGYGGMGLGGGADFYGSGYAGGDFEAGYGGGGGYGGEGLGGSGMGGGRGGLGSSPFYIRFEMLTTANAKHLPPHMVVPQKELEVVAESIKLTIWRDTLVSAIRKKAADSEFVDSAEPKLKELLSRQYVNQLARQKLEITAIEERVSKLRNELTRRESAKQKVVDVQAGRIILEAQGLLGDQ